MIGTAVAHKAYLVYARVVVIRPELLPFNETPSPRRFCSSGLAPS